MTSGRAAWHMPPDGDPRSGATLGGRVTVRRVDHPDALAEALPNANARVEFVAGADFRGRFTTLELPGLLVTASEEVTAGRMVRSTFAADRVIFLRVSGGLVNGETVDPATMSVRRQGAQVWKRVAGFHRFTTLALAPPDLSAWTAALLGRDAQALLGQADRLRPEGSVWGRLVDLQEAALRSACARPEALASAASARVLTDQLADALVHAVAGAAASVERAAQRRGDLILARVERLLEERGDEPLGLTELCTAARCSARTLESLFRERFGEPPNRHLRMRRLWMARRILLAALPGATTVGEIATRYGFWEFGRFAAAYRAAFGETPSATLRRPPDASSSVEVPSNAPFAISA